MTGLKLSHKVSLKLAITPQLKQALYVLQLPHMALKEYLVKQISENPLLQSSDGESLDAKIKNILNSRRDAPQYDRSSSSEIIDAQLVEKHSGPSLNEHLLHQLRMSFLSEEDLSTAQELISTIDSNGYLRMPLYKLAKERNLILDKADEILKIIQFFDPPGVGARNLRECLLIQLKHKQQERSLAYKIIDCYFKELSRKKYGTIAKKLNTNIHKVKEAVNKITSLNPKPGAAFSKNTNIAIVPDFTVRIHKNNLCIDLNKTYLPKLKLNSEYRKLLNDPATTDEVRQFINSRLRNAVWLIKAMEQKQKNSLRVMRAVLGTQKQALSKGLFHLKPLTLKNIAAKTGLHISTVSRIISNKYIDTPQGTIRAKDLFSPRFITASKGAVSRSEILRKIHKLIKDGKTTKALTDRTIADTLSKSGIKISRRTITKYRNSLRISSSFLR